MNKEEKFQVKLAIFIFLLTIMSSILSGYMVYHLTKDKEPYLVISPYRKNDLSPNKLPLQIANIKDVPATVIRVLYKIEESEQSIVSESDIPYLAKGNEFIEIDFKEIDKQIKYYYEELYSNESLFKIGGKFCPTKKKFNIVIKLSCNECNKNNVLFTNSITYTIDTVCEYLGKGKITCDIGSYMISY